MSRLTICLDLAGRTAIVVGGGKVAARKCLSLIKSKADVNVVSPELSVCMERLVRRSWVRHLVKEYSEGDLKGASIVFAATDSSEINRLVAAEASLLGIPVNVADSQELSSFSSPAMIMRGELSIAVATEGKAPALSRRIRKQLAATFGMEYSQTVTLLGKIREKLLTQNNNHRYNKQILSALANSPIPELFRAGLPENVDHLLLELCGPGFSLAELGMRKETT